MKTLTWIVILGVVGYVLFAYRGKVANVIDSFKSGAKAMPPNTVA